MKHGYSKLGAESAPDTYRIRYSSDSPPIRIGCGQRRIGFGQRKFDRTRVRSTRGCGWDSSWIRFSRFFRFFGPGLQVNMGESDPPAARSDKSAKEKEQEREKPSIKRKKKRKK